MLSYSHGLAVHHTQFGWWSGTHPTVELALEWAPSLRWLPDSIVNMIDGLIEQLLPQGSFIVLVYFQQFDPPYMLKCFSDYGLIKYEIFGWL